MRILASFLLINALAFAQNLTEFGAVAAGSTVGGASGKPVSNSISAIFGKVDQQTAKARHQGNPEGKGTASGGPESRAWSRYCRSEWGAASAAASA